MLLNDSNKTYYNKHNTVDALKNINLRFKDTGMVFILGPSGSGNSTILNIISGKDKDYVGSIEGNENVEYIEQEFMLFEAMSVKDNLLLVSLITNNK